MPELKQYSVSFIDDHEVFITTDPATGTVISEAWWKGRWGDKLPDRADGPAIIERDAATGTIFHEEWWKDGKLDRADGPTIIERDAATGIVTYEAWYKDGEQYAPTAEVRAAWLKNSGERIAAPPEKPAHAPRP